MTPDERREPFKEGDEFLQYRVHSLLGRGGHAFVYSGKHRYMERPVAIKVIPAPAEMNSDVYKRARLEARILSQLEHPNVVKVYDAGVTDAGVIYIVMEMLEGCTLRSALKHLKAFTVSEALHVGLQVAAAVQVAHAQQAIHRDLKPENVFILPGNTVKVLDFGITKLLGTNAMTTQPNLIRGTPQYMSPEHMEGRPVTVRSDIYALGSILYELLAATAPALMGLQEMTSYAIGYSQIHRMPPRLDEVSADVPRYVARTVQRMLAKDPKERQESMLQVTEDLLALQNRFATESPAASKTLRELWHPSGAPELAESRSVHSATTAVGNVVLTSQPTVAVRGLGPNTPQNTQPIESLSATHTAVKALDKQAVAPSFASVRPQNRAGSRSAAPAGSRSAAPAGSKDIVARAERVIAQRLAAKQSPSVSVPVTLQRRPRAHGYSVSFLVLSALSGIALGFAALFAYHRTHDLSVPANTERSHSTIVQSASPIAALQSPPVRASLEPQVPKRESMTLPATTKTSDAPGPAASAPVNTRQSSPKPAASSGRSSKASKSKDQLIFGADDLNW
jgi:serine/threonine protein kinase